ncbi:methyltransferase domain-containing protein [Anaerosalibacter massiliensis]|uniref:Class I SAM-dependent methyltransferase n=1 Tax=Anaerosalibacter massiliensis TaxID=1347392 RepID=A0A9X2MFN5_9FIRM|nr:methyltransferase domain-containing protein [Anaerosalibacter massiliensis]MCR2042683.1 class I SAM-dependent methyltransferase [Anaerosalibacter massiliensis]
MELSPRLYHILVRPKWFSKLYVENVIKHNKERIEYAKRLYPEYEFATLESSILPIDDKSIDHILIFSVLHHIDSEELKDYLKEFHRVLKHEGNILVVEPYFKPYCVLKNNCMRYFDKGNYIRTEKEYLDMFNHNKYKTEVINRYSQPLFYNKLFFIASPI